MTTVSIVLLSVWLVASILAQFQIKAMQTLLRRDLFSLLPIWTFFAPRPSSFDHHLSYRVLLANGEHSSWIEVLPCRGRRLSEAFWNPQRRCKKILDATILTLSKRLRGEAKKTIAVSKPYRLLLDHISALPHDAEATAIEFRILRSEGFLGEGGPRVVFQSESHRLGG